MPLQHSQPGNSLYNRRGRSAQRSVVNANVMNGTEKCGLVHDRPN